MTRTTSPSAIEASVGAARAWHLTVTACLAFAAQLVVLSRRDVIILEWRPTDLAAIALNYYRHGFDFLHPQILWGGNGPGYVEMEFPLLPYCVALLYSVFGVHDWVALVIPMLCGIGMTVAIAGFTRRLFGPTAALAAGLFAATAPTWVAMSTGLWPDAPPVFFGVCGVYLLTRWIQDDGPARFAGAAGCVSLAILLKLTSLYLGMPVLFLFWLKYERRWWRTWQAWLFAILALVPSVMWYAHAYRLFLEYHNTFGIIASGYMKFGTASLLIDPRFYVKTFLKVVLFHTTPLGFVLLMFGLIQHVERPVDWILHVWLGAVLIYFVVAAQGIDLGHYQYALPIVPPAAALSGRGLVIVARRMESMWHSLNEGSRRLVAVGACALFAANAAASNYVLQARGMDFRNYSREKMATGKALATMTTPSDLIVVVDANMDDRTPETSMTPPEVFYFSDRRGWYRSISWLTPESIEDLRRQGARYLAVSANNVRWFRTHYADLYDSCSRRYRTLKDDDDGIVYDLQGSSRADVGRGP